MPIALRRGVVTAVVLAVSLGACSDGDDGSSTALGDGAGTTVPPSSTSVGSVPPVESTVAAVPPIETVPVEDSVLAVIRERDDLTTFAAAVEALGTETVFTRERGVTVLAPDDDAFALIGEDQLDALLADPEALANLISDHLAVGSSTTETLVDDGEFTNASARTLVVEVDGDRVMVGSATIVEPDLSTGNGVVHIIDTVLSVPD